MSDFSDSRTEKPISAPGFSKTGVPTTGVSKLTVDLSQATATELSPTISPLASPRVSEDRSPRSSLLGKVTGLLHRSLDTRSRSNSAVSVTSVSKKPEEKAASDITLKRRSSISSQKSANNSTHNGVNGSNRTWSPTDSKSPTDSFKSPRSSMDFNYKLPSPSAQYSTGVKETNHVYLEYDPITKRRVLNTYEILREIGRGEHGKVKLAKDLVNDQLVAIKIVNRKSKKDRPALRLRRDSSTKPAPINESDKIKREIAIMKKCNHKHIVKLIEVLDDMNTNKIYLVLEYLEKGEIRWKRSIRRKRKDNEERNNGENGEEIPCRGDKSRKPSLLLGSDYDKDDDIDQDEYLLSNDFSPNLTFKQTRKIFRDVLLGLEYLHLQGIVHRDIKPANLLVSAENTVKISDFGVSFASSLDENTYGTPINELELAKTAGTPAFFAPELCQTNFSSSTDIAGKSSSSVSATSLEALKNNQLVLTKMAEKIDYKIDIWALGVTLYCLLFGKVPFNADSEFGLFQVIVNQPLEFPKSRFDFNSPGDVSEHEFELAKDLVSKMLDKNSRTRIEIADIKTHPFTLMGLEDDLVSLKDLLHLNSEEKILDLSFNEEISSDEIENAVVGIGSRIRHGLVQAIKAGGGKGTDIREKFAALQQELSRSNSSEDSSSSNLTLNKPYNHSLILSEYVNPSSPISPHKGSFVGHKPSSSYSIAGIRESRPNWMLQEVIDSDTAGSSRRGSSSGVVEAPQIETKRNVGGDLYLKNQSVVDTFKGIQLKDDKRRRSSSLFSVPTLKNNSVCSGSEEREEPQMVAPIPVKKPSHLKVGAYGERPSSVMSLPLSDSFASLDSISDNYILTRYNLVNTGDIQSDPNLVRDHMENISHQFKTFDLGTSMNKGIKFDLNKEKKRTDLEGIAPKARPFGQIARTSSYSTSGTSSSSSSSSNEDESDEEEGNLTLAFSSKVEAPSRPKFLSLNNRAKSHESNLPRLINNPPRQPNKGPVIFTDDLPEFEDVPAGLMAGVPRNSISVTPDMTPSVSLASTESTRTIVPKTDYKGEKVPVDTSPRVSSPLVRNAPTAPQSTVHSHLKSSLRKNIFDNQYNNHYKKDPVYSPFPKAIHLGNDKEEISNAASEKHINNRPSYYRSNSVTVGLLQHRRSSSDNTYERR